MTGSNLVRKPRTKCESIRESVAANCKIKKLGGHKARPYGGRAAV